jgi:hypothetical protein
MSAEIRRCAARIAGHGEHGTSLLSSRGRPRVRSFASRGASQSLSDPLAAVDLLPRSGNWTPGAGVNHRAGTCVSRRTMRASCMVASLPRAPSRWRKGRRMSILDTGKEGLSILRSSRRPYRRMPATVFAFLTDPDKILRWMGTEAQIEPRSGGIYLVNVTGARFACGFFREVVPVHPWPTASAGTAARWCRRGLVWSRSLSANLRPSLLRECLPSPPVLPALWRNSPPGSRSWITAGKARSRSR